MPIRSRAVGPRIPFALGRGQGSALYLARPSGRRVRFDGPREFLKIVAHSRADDALAPRGSARIISASRENRWSRGRVARVSRVNFAGESRPECDKKRRRRAEPSPLQAPLNLGRCECDCSLRFFRRGFSVEKVRCWV